MGTPTWLWTVIPYLVTVYYSSLIKREKCGVKPEQLPGFEEDRPCDGYCSLQQKIWRPQYHKSSHGFLYIPSMNVSRYEGMKSLGLHLSYLKHTYRPRRRGDSHRRFCLNSQFLSDVHCFHHLGLLGKYVSRLFFPSLLFFSLSDKLLVRLRIYRYRGKSEPVSSLWFTSCMTLAVRCSYSRRSNRGGR